MPRSVSGMERISTGVPGFDDMVAGGLPARRLHILCGPPGSGKTTFCAQFVTAGARQGERVLYVTMHETIDELVADMRGYTFGFENAIRSDHVRFLNLASRDGISRIQQFGSESGLRGRLNGMIAETNADRVVIDSKMLLEHFIDNPDDVLSEFLIDLKEADATILMISEMTDPTSYSAEHYLSHGVIFMHNFIEDGGMTRGAQVLKMRGTSIDPDIRHAEFTDSGLCIDADEKIRS